MLDLKVAASFELFSKGTKIDVALFVCITQCFKHASSELFNVKTFHPIIN
jgi:hypothetical protein